jgi:GT2 family glycosyltransferase
MIDSPLVSVVVASHGRPQRLGELLDALAAQTAEGFEVVVVHDDGPGRTAELLSRHRLAERGVLRHVALPSGTGTAAGMRNAGWREGAAPLVAFTDDDCRPSPSWLAALLVAAGAHPGAVIQGRTTFRADESHRLREHLLIHTVVAEPPTRFGQTCNIAYPRALLERVGGFHEAFRLPVGEDVDLLWRARGAGAPHVAAPGALVQHAIEPTTLRERVRRSARYGQLAAAAKRNPAYRRAPEHPFGRFAKQQHPRLLLGAAGLAAAPRRPALAVLALPWLLGAAGPLWGCRQRGRSLRRLAAWAVVDAADVAALARVSLAERTVFL